MRTPNQARQMTHVAAATAAAMALLLGACSRTDDSTVGQKFDQAVATTEREANVAEVVKADVNEATAATPAATDSAAAQVGQQIEQAVEAMGQKVADAAVTASINAELARDPALSAVRIEVDTSAGRVKLSGTAPDADARDRATRLAAAVKGVTSVDNRLQIDS